MIVRIENVNEDNEVYDEPVEVVYDRTEQWASLNIAVHDAMKMLYEFPNDSVRITVVKL